MASPGPMTDDDGFRKTLGTGGSGREFDAGMAGLGVEADPAETPRFDLWRRIWTHRGSGVEGASSVAENSLF